MPQPSNDYNIIPMPKPCSDYNIISQPCSDYNGPRKYRKGVHIDSSQSHYTYS